MKLFFLFLIFSATTFAETKSFYCTSEAILKMDFIGILEDGKLVGDLGVNIEDSFFEVKKEDIKEFWNKETSKGHEFGFLVDEKATSYWIDLQVLDSRGKVSSDYRGITLKENNVYCDFESLL